MGNCESSLDCDTCYSTSGDDGCETELNVNADVAGIGVLISFGFSAHVMVILLLIYYLKDSLPQSAITNVDRIAIETVQGFGCRIRKLFFSKHRDSKDSQTTSTSANTPPSKITSKLSARGNEPGGNEPRIKFITRFVLSLSDQQLVTGLAISIAGLTSRCKITLYEFNIVVRLAYFAISVYVVSLPILREYHYEHQNLRNGRTMLTMLFLALFCFIYIVGIAADEADDTGADRQAYHLGTVLQCVFRTKKLVRSGSASQITIFNAFWVLSGTIYRCAYWSAYLFIDPEPFEDGRERRLGNEILRMLIRKSADPKFAVDETNEIIESSDVKYLAWIQPTQKQSGGRIRIPYWLYIDRYNDTYMSEIATAIQIIAYGNTQTIIATWYGGIPISDKLKEMNYGQVVAIGLLFLPFLAAAEIYAEVNAKKSDEESDTLSNPQNMSSTQESGTASESNTESEGVSQAAHASGVARSSNENSNETSQVPQVDSAPDDSNVSQSSQISQSHPDRSKELIALEFLCTIIVHKPVIDLRSIASGKIPPSPEDAETRTKVTKRSVLFFFFEVLLRVYISIGIHLNETNLSAFTLAMYFIVLRIAGIATRYGMRIYFIRDEIIKRRPKGQTMSSNTSPSSPTPSATNSGQGRPSPLQRTETDLDSSPPRRCDTEADIGLQTLKR